MPLSSTSLRSVEDSGIVLSEGLWYSLYSLLTLVVTERVRWRRNWGSPESVVRLGGSRHRWIYGFDLEEGLTLRLRSLLQAQGKQLTITY
jgi:hypothetical protein